MPHNPRAVLGLTATSYFMVVLDSLVVVTALPKIGAQLHAGLPTLQWTVNAYGIAVAAGIIAAAALGDRIGRKRMFIAGVMLFTLSSAACALSDSAGTLIAARAVQGLGGAAILPLSLTILIGAFPIERRGMIIGIYGGLAGLAVAAGPLVGGAVTQGLSWHWIFWINVPIGLLASALSLRLLSESRGPLARLDVPGILLVAAGSVSFVWGLTRSGALGFGNAQVLCTLIAGALLIAAFVVWEGRAPAPMVPLRLFRERGFAAGNVASFMMTGSIFGGGFMIIQYAQLARGYSPVDTGVRLLPWLGMPMFVSPLAGALGDRIGPRPVIATGLTLQALGFGWVAARAGSGLSYPEMAAALCLAGIGISMALPTVPAAVLSAVMPHEIGKASGVTTTMQRFGSVFAVATATAVFTGSGSFHSAHTVTAGFRPALGVCAALSLLGALAALGIRAQERPVAAAVAEGGVPIFELG
jgi:EmrB/QacA subfamily drug resistance transporter